MKTENNKIIADFMGYKIESNEVFPLLYLIHADWFAVEELKFHSDWNWLMEVVENIESNGFNFEIKKNWARISRKGENIILRWEEDRSKIEAVYNACIEFIKWYNEQKKIEK